MVQTFQKELNGTESSEFSVLQETVLSKFLEQNEFNEESDLDLGILHMELITDVLEILVEEDLDHLESIWDIAVTDEDIQVIRDIIKIEDFTPEEIKLLKEFDGQQDINDISERIIKTADELFSFINNSNDLSFEYRKLKVIIEVIKRNA